MDNLDYGVSTRDSGVSKAYLMYTEWTEEQFAEASERADALMAEEKYEEALSLQDQSSEAVTVLVFFFGISNDRFSVEQVLEESGGAREYRKPVEVGKMGDFTFWMTVPSPDSQMMKAMEKQSSPEGFAALVKAHDEIMAHPEAAALNEAAGNAKYPEPGSKVSFETTDLDGNPVTSEEIFSKNKVTLVNFWQNACQSCLDEMPELDRLNREYADKGFEVVSVSCENFSREEALAEAKQISAQYGIRTLRLNESLHNALYHLSTPTTYFIDSEGTILADPIEGAHLDQISAGIEAYLNGTAAEVPTDPGKAKDGNQTWTIRVVDQEGKPVPEVYVSFCSDVSCTMVELGDDGIGSFTGPEGRYHITFVSVPAEYNTDSVEDLYTDESTSSITVTLPKK